MSLPSPRDGLTANTSILVDLSDSPVRNEDSGSPKSEIQEAEMLINQIPATRKEDTLESITQTQLDSDGFRKPALPPKATIGITRSPIVSSKATASRYAPLKRPNQSSGRYSPLGPVETDIESSQELPPLKRTKLAPPRRNSFAEPKSFNSINQGAQDMTMRDHISPDLMDEPLRGWPSRNGYVLEPQPTTMQEDPAQGSRLRKGAGQTRTSLFKMNGETQNTVSSSYTAADWKSSGLLPNYESGSERLYPGQHDLVGQDGFDPISTNNRDNTDAGAAVNRPQSQVEACDTFDIPSSPSPELPTSAQASTKARLNVSGPRSKGSNQVRDRKSGFSRTSPRDGSLENQAVNVTRSPSLPNRRPDSFPARTPQKSSWKMGKEDASEEGRDETRQERSSERRNRRQEPVTNSDSAMESRGASTITESSAIQTQSRPRDITPAKKTNLEVPSHISSILRTSNSQDRRLGTSVSFADDCEEPAIDPSPSHQSACFVPVNLPQERKSEETLSSNSRILERIKGGFKGVSRSSDSTTEKMNPLKKLVKGKERAQEPRESLSPRPKVANRISNDTLDNDEYWEPYTIDGNRGPSRNPGMAKWQCPSNTSESGVVESNPQILHPPNTVKVTKRAQSISSIRTESSRGSSGSSTPRSPAKEIVSPALGNSVEASVIEGSTSRSESEDSGLEGSEKAVEAQEEASQFVHKPPINDSSEPNGPITANLSVDIPLKNNSPGAGGSSQNAHNHWSSEDEPEDHAEEDDAAELQLQSENRRSMELGSSQKKLDTVQSPPSTKEPRTPALRRKSSRVSQAKARNPPKQAPKAKLPVSTNPPRPFNGRFVGVSALNAKSKTNGTSHKSLSNSTRTGPSNCSSVAKAVQIDSPDVSDSSSSDDSEVEIKADSKGRQSRNKALEGLISVQNRKSCLTSTSWLAQCLTWLPVFANGKKAPKR